MRTFLKIISFVFFLIFVCSIFFISFTPAPHPIAMLSGIGSIVLGALFSLVFMFIDLTKKKDTSPSQVQLKKPTQDFVYRLAFAAFVFVIVSIFVMWTFFIRHYWYY